MGKVPVKLVACLLNDFLGELANLIINELLRVTLTERLLWSNIGQNINVSCSFNKGNVQEELIAKG